MVMLQLLLHIQDFAERGCQPQGGDYYLAKVPKNCIQIVLLNYLYCLVYCYFWPQSLPNVLSCFAVQLEGYYVLLSQLIFKLQEIIAHHVATLWRIQVFPEGVRRHQRRMHHPIVAIFLLKAALR